MRLFLDAHLSGRRIGEPLRADGHDVRAADEERLLVGKRDEELLDLATREHRTLVTLDVRDYSRIVRRWAEAGKHHAGCATLTGIRQSEFGVIIRALRTTLAKRPDQEDWIDYTAFVGRRG